MNCKLIGQFVQHIEVTLDPGESFFAEKGALIYLESGIEKDLSFNGSGLGRILGAKLSGESLFILRLYNNSPRPRKAAIGSRFGLLPIRLEGESLICHRGVYVGSSAKVDVSTKLSISGLVGGMGLLLQKITGRATVFLDVKGTPITISLPPGETIEVDEDHIVAMQYITEGQMSSNWSLGNLLGGEGLSMLRVTGPGKIYLTPGAHAEEALPSR